MKLYIFEAVMGIFLQKYSYMNVLLLKYSILYLGQMNCFQWDKENPSELAQVRKKSKCGRISIY